MKHVIAIQPLALRVLPVNGRLAVLIDPNDVLANPDGVDMLADVIRSLAAGRGIRASLNTEQLASYLNWLITDQGVGPGQSVLLETVAMGQLIQSKEN